MKVFYLLYGVNHPVDAKALAALKAAGVSCTVLRAGGKQVGGIALVKGHGAFETGRMIRRIRKAGVPVECLPLG